MVCNCQNAQNNNVIEFIKGTTMICTFNFNEDISSYTSAEFVIRKDYNTQPVIDIEVTEIQEKSLTVELSPEETNLFTEFQNGQNSAKYIWGLDLIDSVNNLRINVFPQTGNSAPLCIVYKHV